MQKPERLVLVLTELTAAVERLEAAAARARAAEATRLAGLLDANAEVGAHLAATAATLRALSTATPARPDPAA